MTPWIKRGLMGLFGATLMVGALSACSHGRDAHGPMTEQQMAEMRGKLMDRVSSQLKLNDAQQQKLKVLADTLHTQRMAMMGDTKDPHAALAALVMGPTFERARAQSLLDEKIRAVQAGGPEVIAALANFYDSLDAGQQAQARDLMQRRHRAGWSLG